jgi:NDP-sugar pyrophosphorylase family protein
MKAMVFAAGFGSRLRPLTNDIPKPLIRIKNKPLLDWIVLQLQLSGIKSAIVNTHYLHEKIENHIKTAGYAIPVTVSHEEKILGTGGALVNTRNFWDRDDFYLCNSDILCTAPLPEFFTFHRKTGNMVTLGINDRNSDSMLLIDEEGLLVGIQRKGTKDIRRKPLGRPRAVGFCGFHMISPGLFSQLSVPVAFSIIDEYLALIEKGISISTWSIGEAYWEDIGTPQRLQKAESAFPGFT